ncbi:MAG: hypothetical protein CSA83_01790 [Actinomycetales bacterium]|nr:MAG: hypothetical protein CSA83_01790 [Actinomycetales bacterium]
MVINNEVIVKLKDGYGGQLPLFQRLIHPKTNLDTSVSPALGAGPFEVIKHTSTSLELAPNPKWWGKKPNLEHVSLKVLSHDQALAEFLAGNLDAFDIAGRMDIRRLGNTNIERGSRIDHTLLQLNHKSARLADESIRSAIAHGINRQELVEYVLADLSYEEKAVGSLTSYEYQSLYRDLITDIIGETNPQTANELLDNAGWRKWADGIRVKDGNQLRLKLIVAGDGPLITGLRNILVQQLHNLGIIADAPEIKRAELSQVLADGNFDIAIRELAGTPQGCHYLASWYGENGLFSASSGIDQQLLAASVGKNSEVLAGEKLGLQQLWLLPIWNGLKLVATAPGLVNIGPTGFANPPKTEIGWK